jgi:hypothetical protein
MAKRMRAGLRVDRPLFTEVFLYGIMECFENTEVPVQNGVDLFEVQTPVNVNQNIAKSRQIREIGDERFREDPLFTEDLECFTVTRRPPESLLGDQIGCNIDWIPSIIA